LLSEIRLGSQERQQDSLWAFLLHQPGALFHALSDRARGINLVKIESRPICRPPIEFVSTWI